MLCVIFLSANKDEAEQCAGNGAGDEKLHRQRHDEIAAIGDAVIGDKLRREAVAVPDAENTCERDLTEHCEYLNGENDENGSILRSDDAERELFRDGAGDEERAQEDDDVFYPHVAKRIQERFVCECARCEDDVIKRHDIDHDPRGDGSEDDGLKFGFRHFGTLHSNKCIVCFGRNWAKKEMPLRRPTVAE